MLLLHSTDHLYATIWAGSTRGQALQRRRAAGTRGHAQSFQPGTSSSAKAVPASAATASEVRSTRTIVVEQLYPWYSRARRRPSSSVQRRQYTRRARPCVRGRRGAGRRARRVRSSSYSVFGCVLHPQCRQVNSTTSSTDSHTTIHSMTNGGTSDNLMIVDGADDEYNIAVGIPVHSIVSSRYLVALPGSAVECVLGC
eukprot:COSAG02_NODE_3788_length_6230_cov_10.029033_4_plen_198_part_00